MKILKLICKGLVWLWRKVFPKKYRAIKPTGSSYLVCGAISGIEPLFNPTYTRISKINIIKTNDIELNILI